MVFRKTSILFKKKAKFFALCIGGLLFFYPVAVCVLYAQTGAADSRQVYQKTHLVKLHEQKINEGATVDLSIIVGDVSIKKIDVLSDNFEVIERIINSRINFDNGIPSKETMYIYRLSPYQAGKYRFNVSIDGEIYGPFLVTVVAQQNPNRQSSPFAGVDPNAQQAFIKFYSQKKKPLYINEPTTLIYELFHDTSYSQGNMRKPSSHIGLALIDVSRDSVYANPSTTKVEINGKIYNKSIVLRKIAYPLFSGKHNIEDGMFRVVMPVGRYLFNKRLMPIDVKIPTLEIEAIDFPTTGKPANFKNNFGDFEITVTADSQSVERGVPQLYKIKASGSGNFEALILPKIAQTQENDYFVNRGDLENAYRYEAGNFHGSKTRNYYVSYNKAGQFTLPDITFSAFSRKQGYMETNIAFPTVSVYAKDEAQTMVGEKTKKALPKIVTELSSFDKQQEMTVGRILLNHLFAGIAFVALAFSLLIVHAKKQKREMKNNTPLVIVRRCVAALRRETETTFEKQSGTTLAQQQHSLLIRLKTALEDFLYKTNEENRGQTLRNIAKKLHQQLQAGTYLIEEEKKQFALYIALLSKVSEYQQQLFDLKIDRKTQQDATSPNANDFHGNANNSESKSDGKRDLQEIKGIGDRQTSYAQAETFKTSSTRKMPLDLLQELEDCQQILLRIDEIGRNATTLPTKNS